MKSARVALLVISSLSLLACSGGSTSRIDYKEAKTLPSLDVPPSLTVPVDTGTTDVPSVVDSSGSTQGGILPLAAGMEIGHDGNIRWLRLDAEPERLWPRLRQFWPTLGLELSTDAPGIGIMETAWAENRADAPGGFLTGMVKKVFKNAYSADTRDKYRLRIEPLPTGGSEIYISHYGLKQIVAGQTVEGFVDTAWEVRPSDTELANEILNRLVLFLGGDRNVAEQAREASTEIAESPRARIVEEQLLLDEGFNRAWRLTGLALDRIGLVVTDRNRSAGIYYVSEVDQLRDAEGDEKEGWFSSLFGSDKPEESRPASFEVHLSGDDTRSRILLRDEQGGLLTREQAVPILKRLQETLN